MPHGVSHDSVGLQLCCGYAPQNSNPSVPLTLASHPNVRTPTAQPISDPWLGEPARHPALVVRSVKPFNAETPPALLCDKLITPADVHYKRNHLPVPELKPEEYKLTVRREWVWLHVTEGSLIWVSGFAWCYTLLRVQSCDEVKPCSGWAAGR